METTQVSTRARCQIAAHATVARPLASSETTGNNHCRMRELRLKARSDKTPPHTSRRSARSAPAYDTHEKTPGIITVRDAGGGRRQNVQGRRPTTGARGRRAQGRAGTGASEAHTRRSGVVAQNNHLIRLCPSANQTGGVDAGKGSGTVRKPQQGWDACTPVPFNRTPRRLFVRSSIRDVARIITSNRGAAAAQQSRRIQGDLDARGRKSPLTQRCDGAASAPRPTFRRHFLV
jgi:hypothetical protein